MKKTFDDYFDSIGVPSGIDRQNLSNAIYNLIVSDNLSSISQLGDDSTSAADTLWKLGKKVPDSLQTKYSGYNANMDLDSNPNPFNGMNVIELLTQSQLDEVKNTTHFPGTKYTRGKTDKDGYTKNQYLQCDYSAPKTVGFYQLRNSFFKLNDSINTYMFVSDANAPTPLYEVAIDPENIGLDNWWNDQDNAKSVAYSLMFEQDSSLFDDIGEVNLPQEVGKIFYKCKNGKEWDTKKPLPTYNDLLKSNIDYHFDNESAAEYKSKLKEMGFDDTMDKSIPEEKWKAESYRLNSVFQSLKNPYTSTNVVWATRIDYNKFTNALKTNYSKNTYPWWNKKNKNATTGITNTDLNQIGYLFMLGLPCGHTGKKNQSARYEEGWRKSYEHQKTKKGEFAITLSGLITSNVFPETVIPGDWAKVIWDYATTGES